MNADHTVRPRWVWAGATVALAGIALAGLGIALWAIPPIVAGAVLLAAGAAAAVRGGILYDTHGARPVRAELAEVRTGEVHQGTSPGDMLTEPPVRRDARATSKTAAEVATARAGAARPGLVRAAAMLLMVGGGFVLCAQGLYAHTPQGQDNAVRDLGLAIVIALAGLRLLVGFHPGRRWSLLAGCSGLVLAMCAVLTQHDAGASIFVEVAAGAWVVVAAAVSLNGASAQTGARPRGRHV